MPAAMAPLSAETHFSRLVRGLDLEAEAEAQSLLDDLRRGTPAEAEAAGRTLLDLVIRDEAAGLGGRALLTLGKRNQTLALPWTRLRPGSPVLLSELGVPAADPAGWRGVVSRVQREAIEVAFPQWPEPEAERPVFRLDHATDEVARQRLRQALEAARTAAGGRLAALREVLLAQRPARFQPDAAVEALDAGLNDSQRTAVRFALTAEDVAVIHGPPGTGKTTTLVELIRQITRRGQTVLACAPSNLAVDNLLERLAAAGEPVLRLGHPARVLPELREHTLDLLVERHPDSRRAEKLTREARALRARAGKFTRARPEPGARQALRHEAAQMLAEARRLETEVVDRLLDGARILCATTTGLDGSLLGSRTFDWCVLDEAGQGVEPAAWIPLLRADRLVLAGDHCQLPPTVVSPEAAAAGYGVSLMERLLNDAGPELARLLTVQYRMHAAIMAFSSAEFYAGQLTAAPGVRAHRLCDLPGVAACELTETPVLFVDTAGAGYDEAPEPGGDSRLNPWEAELVARQAEALLAAGLAPAQIAVITPYAAQARRLRARLLQPDLEVDSVDGFQGREKEAVLVSLVRSNRAGEIGFLADVRRMNVALTRARRKLIVVGDSATVAAHPFYQRLVAHFEASGAYRSVWEDEHRPA